MTTGVDARSAPDASTIALQPGVIGAEANRRLAPLRPQDRPRPGLDRRSEIGGIAANNASGMCCGTAQNSYQARWRACASCWPTARCSTPRRGQPSPPSATPRSDLRGRAGACWPRRRATTRRWPTRIRHKFRIKNTTGYSLNALVDFTDPIDILAHLMIGSEGTLGFISRDHLPHRAGISDKASALYPVPTSETACRAVTRAESHTGRGGRTARPRRAALGRGQARPAGEASARWAPDGAALLVETRADSAPTLTVQIARHRSGIVWPPHERARALSPPTRPTCARFWNVRKGMFPSVGAMRAAGTTVIIEDVAFPDRAAGRGDARPAAPAAARTAIREAIIFGHALEGNLHFVFTQDFMHAAEVERYRRFMDDAVPDGGRQIRRLAQGRARHRPQHGALRRAGVGRARPTR